MAKMEKEVKVLNIDLDSVVDIIKNNNGVFVEECIQKIYTYDLGTIVGRYRDLLLQFKDDNFELMKSKFNLLFFEIDNLMTPDMKSLLIQNYGIDNLVQIVMNTNNMQELTSFVNEKVVQSLVSNFGINPNKWVRLRETNNKTTITVKNILETTIDFLQPVLEAEVEVPSIKDANALLEQLGFSFRNYQEKRRITYSINGTELDIDFWPLIPPYLEIEGNSMKEIDDVIDKLNLRKYEIVSCNTEEVYKKYGINIYDYRELRLDEKSECKQNMLEHNRKM